MPEANLFMKPSPRAGPWRLGRAPTPSPGSDGLAPRLGISGRKLAGEWPLILFLCALLGGSAVYLRQFLGNLDLVNLLYLNFDDAFYYCQIARNLAAGEFSTFDGGTTRTNGYHPLWLLLITPFYWIFDPETALYGIKAFEFALVSGAVGLIVLAGRLACLPWILLFATLPLLARHRALVSGMEASAALFTLGLLFVGLSCFGRNPGRWKWALAAIAFALPWARLEYAAISLAATAALCFGPWPERPEPRANPRWTPLGSAARLQACVPLLGAVAGILAYAAYNLLVFGSSVPISGTVKQIWSRQAWALEEGGYSLAGNLRDIMHLSAFDGELLAALEVCLYFLLVWLLAHRSRNREDRLLLVFLLAMFSLAVGHLAKFAQTVLTMHPAWAAPPWYFVPAYLMMALLVPTRFFVASYAIRRFIRPGSRRLAQALRLAALAATLAILATQALAAIRFATVERVRKESRGQVPLDHEIQLSMYAGTQVLNRILPAGSVVGAWNAGVVGYFSRFPVVNLDGLVNSLEYVSDQHGTIDRQLGITHFANHASVAGNLADPLFEGWAFDFTWGGLPHPLGGRTYQIVDYRYPAPGQRIPRIPDTWQYRAGPQRNQPGSPGPDDAFPTRKDSFAIWPYEPPPESARPDDPASAFWERMEPHFAFQTDETAIFMAGRMALAFTRDCEGEGRQREEIAFSWQSEDGEQATEAWRPWDRGETNRLGICAAYRVLPFGLVEPVRIEVRQADARLAAGRERGGTDRRRADAGWQPVGFGASSRLNDAAPLDSRRGRARTGRPWLAAPLQEWWLHGSPAATAHPPDQ